MLEREAHANKAVRYVTRTTAAAAGAVATAATSVAAAALAASIILSPAADASARLDGVHADLARAVQLNQITEEQAAEVRGKAGRPHPRGSLIFRAFWRRFDAGADSILRQKFCKVVLPAVAGSGTDWKQTFRDRKPRVIFF